MTGDSRTSQTNAEALGIRPGFEIHVAGEPADYESLVGELPEGGRIAGHLGESTDLAHLFVTRRVELAMALQIYRKKLRATTIVWVSWPTNAEPGESDISGDTVRQLASSMGFLEKQACALTAQWSGICFEISEVEPVQSSC
jgi:hypothetical protein